MTTPNNEPASAWLKIRRAGDHADELLHEVRAYLATKPVRLMVLDNTNLGELVYTVRQVAPVPDAVAIILGDVIHNLRAALDHVAFWLLQGTEAKPDAIQFPFCYREEDLAKAMERRQITAFAGERVIAEVKALRPYKAGSRWLYGLDRLDVLDKHKLLIATAGVAAMDRKLMDAVFGPMGLIANRFSMTVGSQVTVPYWPSSVHRDARYFVRVPEEQLADPQPDFEVWLGDGQPLTDGPAPLLPIVAKLFDEVEGAVRRLTAAHLADRAAKASGVSS